MTAHLGGTLTKVRAARAGAEPHAKLHLDRMDPIRYLCACGAACAAAGVPDQAARSTKSPVMAAYDCSKCPGYCCSYPEIGLVKQDVERLAKHFGVSFADAERKFTRSAYGRKWVLRRKKDEHFGKICRFFDSKKRNCGIYKARPKTCRAFPNRKSCGYYDFLTWEREHQQDPDFVATTDNGVWP